MADNPYPDARVFSPKLRFQTMARRPSGVPRSKAIENAQAMIDEIKPGFEDWLGGELDALSGLIERLKSGRPEAGWLDAAEFHCRQLRDVGTTMGFALLTFIANTLCIILDGIKAGAECNVDSITCHMDALLLIRQPQYRNLQPDQVPELINGLRLVAESVSIVPGGGET
jgi:hypothetical protein